MTGDAATTGAVFTTGDTTLRRRRSWTLAIAGIVVVVLPYVFGHRGVHAVRSLIVPGAGLYDHRHAWIGATFTLAAIAATVLWVRWGTDWFVAVVVVASMVAAGALAYTDHPMQRTQVVFAAHEFPLVASCWVRCRVSDWGG